jgi:sialate O-acetylesterase
MRIEAGLFANMVLQRDARGRSDAVFSGACGAAGGLKVLVRQRGRPLRGFDGVSVGAAQRARFRGRLQGLPAGGPYEIELRVESDAGHILDSCLVRNVMVGDVWILAGQSNMAGDGLLKEAAKPDPRVRAFYMHDRWGVARDPIHNVADSMDPVHGGRGDGKCSARRGRPGAVGTGPGVAFGREMQRRTGVPQGLIPCALGGTSMAQWDPARKGDEGRSLYGAMRRRFVKNGSRVAGVVWYQGCAEASESGVAAYSGRMKALVRAMRRDLRNPRLPFVLVQIARVFGAEPAHARWWNAIQDQQRRLSYAIARCAVVPAVDLDMEDAVHLSGAGQNRLGARLAQAMSVLMGDRKAGKPPIGLGKVVCDRHPINGTTDIQVQFSNVMGRLQSAGKPSGFSVRVASGGEALYRVRLKGDRAILNTAAGFGSTALLYYGYGTAPWCNITDSADRSLPVFGPVSAGAPTVYSPFVENWRVSRALPSAGNLTALPYPRNLGRLAFRTRVFSGGSCLLHRDLFATAPRDVRVFFRCCLDCPEPMRAALCLGYDGPVRVWLDRKVRFHDPRGTNPIGQDKAVIPFAATPGRHEILIALGSNHGRAWGMRLRIQRTDLTRDRIERGPSAYRMPMAVV